MFEENTVFILGAGASWHYGYPTGEELVKKIIEKSTSLSIQMDSRTLSHKRYNGFGRPFALIMDTHIPSFEINTTREMIIENCKTLSTKLSQTNTLVIDDFLSMQSPAIQEIGKFLIAWIILDCERDYFQGFKQHNNNNYNRNRLEMKKDDGNKIASSDLKNYKDDWIRFILHRITSGCHSKTIEKIKEDAKYLNDNTVKFITFNYDVSLEQSILKGLQAFSDYFDKDEIKDFLSNDRFVHMYGQIRKEIHLDNFHQNFKPIEIDWDQNISPNPSKVYEASKLIRTIENIDKSDDKIFKKAQKIIKEAQQIYILGFGFDERNCVRLGLSKDAFIEYDPKSISFTNYTNSDVINKKVNRLFDLDGHFFRGSRNLTSKADIRDLDCKNTYERSIMDVYTALADDIEL